MEKLKENWKAFALVILDPWSLALIGVTAGLYLWSTSEEMSAQTGAILTTLVIVSSAILGGRIWNLWTDLTEEKVLITRGKLSIRNLNVLTTSIAGLERRLAVFIQDYKQKKTKQDPVIIAP